MCIKWLDPSAYMSGQNAFNPSSVLKMMICPVNPVDGAVAVPPERSSIQSSAHPSFAVVSRQAGGQAGRQAGICLWG